jgi:hypothetical protein
MSAIGALLLTCAWVPVAGARQSSGASATANKSTTAKSTTRKHHKTASKATGSPASAVTHTATTGKRSSRKKKSARARGQQKIDSDRAQSIQEALIREHYLSGEPTGTWNQASEEAMRRYQGDHGWQTKEVPDSRALIKLGLGPSKDHLLNPESAMVTGPDAPRAESLPPTSHSAAPVNSTPVQSPSQNDPPSPQ